MGKVFVIFNILCLSIVTIISFSITDTGSAHYLLQSKIMEYIHKREEKIRDSPNEHEHE